MPPYNTVYSAFHNPRGDPTKTIFFYFAQQ